MDWIIEENIKSFAKWFVDNQSRIAELEEENRKLKEKVKKLEEWLDRKEEINKKLRSDLLMYQHQYWCLTD